MARICLMCVHLLGCVFYEVALILIKKCHIPVTNEFAANWVTKSGAN
jgi:hypothetical protein